MWRVHSTLPDTGSSPSKLAAWWVRQASREALLWEARTTAAAVTAQASMWAVLPRLFDPRTAPARAAAAGARPARPASAGLLRAWGPCPTPAVVRERCAALARDAPRGLRQTAATMDLVAAVTAAFAERAGRRPDGVWRAPGRVNLIGEHTDYNDGFVLPVAIDRSLMVAAARRDDDGLRCWSTRDRAGDRPPPVRGPAEIGPGRSTGWAAYAEGVAWALRARGVAG